MSRTCGSCQICCWAFAVNELGKPEWTSCQHLTRFGCSIHDKPDKPQACSDFRCIWLRGKFRPEDRPDKSGLLVTWAVPHPELKQIGEQPYAVRQVLPVINQGFLCRLNDKRPLLYAKPPGDQYADRQQANNKPIQEKL